MLTAVQYFSDSYIVCVETLYLFFVYFLYCMQKKKNFKFLDKWH